MAGVTNPKRRRVESHHLETLEEKATVDNRRPWKCIPFFSGKCIQLSEEKQDDKWMGGGKLYHSQSECEANCPTLHPDLVSHITTFLPSTSIPSLRLSGKIGDILPKQVLDSLLERQVLEDDIKKIVAGGMTYSEANKLVRRICALVSRGYGSFFSSSILTRVILDYPPWQSAVRVGKAGYLFDIVKCMVKNGWNVPGSTKVRFILDLSNKTLNETALSSLIKMGFLDNLDWQDAALAVALVLRSSTYEDIDWSLIEFLLKKVDPNKLDPVFVTYLWNIVGKYDEDDAEDEIIKTTEAWQLLQENKINLTVGVDGKVEQSEILQRLSTWSVEISNYLRTSEILDNFVHVYEEVPGESDEVYLQVVNGLKTLLSQPYYKTRQGVESIRKNYDYLLLHFPIDDLIKELKLPV